MGVWRDAVLQVKDEFESCSAILLFKYDRKIYIYQYCNTCNQNIYIDHKKNSTIIYCILMYTTINGVHKNSTCA